MEQIGLFAYNIAKAAFNEVLYRLDDPSGADFDLDNEEEYPIWALMEVVESDDNSTLTGRRLEMMYEVFPNSTEK